MNVAQRVEDTVRTQTMRLLASPFGSVKTSVAEKISLDGKWPDVLRLCQQWNVLPTLASLVGQGVVAVPVAQSESLQRENSIAFFRSTLCLRVGCEALRLLDNAGIRAVAFKGCAVISHLHASGRERMIKDVDVLIGPDDLHATLELLEANNFKRTVGEGSLADYIAFVRNSPGAVGNQAVSLEGRQGTSLDLHWKLGRLDATKLIETAWRVPVQGFQVPVVRPAFGLLLTVHHAIRNDFVPDEIARDVLDSGGWFRLLANDPTELACAMEYAEQWGLADALGAMRLIVEHFGQSVPSLGQSVPSRDKKPSAAASSLAGLYLRQLASEPINTDLAYLGSSRAVRQVLFGALSGWGRYAGFMRSFEASNGEESLSLWQRIQRVARSARGMSLTQWREIRALARAKDRLSE